jgi:hypothetical protein
MDPDHVETDPEAVLAPADHEGEEWAEALERGDADLARDRFIADLRTGPTRVHPSTILEGPARNWHERDPEERIADAEKSLAGTYEGAAGLEHTFGDEINWFLEPTEEAEGVDFTREWQWCLNRQSWWPQFASAYAETGDEKYAHRFESELRDWIASCPRPAHRSEGSFPQAWRTIEAGIRAGQTWPFVFETFRRCEAISDETLWLWVCSFRDHGRHLLRWPMGDNWKGLETNGLCHVATMFPELDGAYGFYSTAIDRAIAELERQFYPDGMQVELSPGYGLMSAGLMDTVLTVAGAFRDEFPPMNGLEIPQMTQEKQRDIILAYARLAGPDGTTPPLHDSGGVDMTDRYESHFPGQPPWTSNESDLIEWPGYAILRAEGRYGLLDAGPYGTAHQHQDTLQFVGYADGEWWPVDPGSPQYTDAPETAHIRSAAGHNVVLLDGEPHGVRPEVERATSPHPVAVAEAGPLGVAAATRSFETTGRTDWDESRDLNHVDGGEPDGDEPTTFDHERVVCDVASVGWVVFDRVRPRDDEPHAAEWLWHAPGEWTVADGGATVERNGGAALRIESAGPDGTTASVATGERDPLRGWGPVGEENSPAPLPALRVRTPKRTGSFERATLLSPAGATIKTASFGDHRRTVRIERSDREVTVRALGADWIERVECEVGATTGIDLDGHALHAEER